jgi:superfamily II DNA or RNA helicase
MAIVKKTARLHQGEAVEDVSVKFEAGVERGILAMACGTGKTLSSMWIAERVAEETVLIVIPSLALLSEFLSEWRFQANLAFEYIVVCSDKDVTEEHWAEDNIVLNDDAYKVTTAPHTIAAFMQKVGQRRYIFSTYHSLHRITHAVELMDEHHGGFTFDLAIADEAHRCAGRHDARFTMLVNDDLIHVKRRLFVTATPKIFVEDGDAEDDVYSMDNEEYFGKVLHMLPFRKAIELGLLSDYRIMVAGISPSEVPWLDPQDPRYRTILRQVALARAIHDCGLTRILTFHSNIKKMHDFTAELDERIIPKAMHAVGSRVRTETTSVTFNTPMGERAAQLRDLASPTDGICRIVSNCSCLSEGIDVPELDAIGYIDPKSSVISIVQSLGRVMRLSDEKEIGTVIIPVIVPDDADAEAAVRDESFGTVWHVMEALRACDDEFKSVVERVHKRREASEEPEEPFEYQRTNPPEVVIPPTEIVEFHFRKEVPDAIIVGDTVLTSCEADTDFVRPVQTVEDIEVRDIIRLGNSSVTLLDGRKIPRVQFMSTFRDDIPGIMRAMYSRFLSLERKYPFEGDTPENAVARWGCAYFQHNNRYPNRRSGVVSEYPTLTWRLLDDWMRIGRNGFTAGGSLIDFFNLTRPADLDVKEIKKWIRNYIAIHKVVPGANDDPVPEYSSMTWRNLNKCLRMGRRGLPGGMTLQSLAGNKREMIRRERPTTGISNQAPGLVRNFINTNGKRPLSTSTDEIEELKATGVTMTWRQLAGRVNSCGINGRKVAFSNLVSEIVAELGMAIPRNRGNRYSAST